MIPLRIKLDGFMSYRDPQEISFEGATLWMLAGQNGAGKSAVFDAMTYALYDQHRLGAQRADELINKGRDELLVDFEFRCDNDTYRISRTHSRQGSRSTRQVFHVAGPHAPNPAVAGEQPIVGTDSAQGFKDWVRETIGLDYNTFTASVLLCQGKADALLEADPKDRHAILSQIVDLRDYEHLHEAAKERAKTHQDSASVFQGQIALLASVTGEDLAAAEARVATTSADVRTALEAVKRLAELKGHAASWERLTDELEHLREAVEAARTLLGQSNQIERDAARLGELRAVVPPLRALLDARARLLANDEAISAALKELARHEAHEHEAARALDEASATLRELSARHAECERDRSAALSELNALRPRMEQIARIREQRKQVADADAQLATYPPNLDERRARLAAQVAQIEEMREALPWLERLVLARGRWVQSRASARAAASRLAEIATRIPTGLAAQGIASATAYAEHERQAVAAATADVRHEQARLRRLREVEGKPTCSYCGQPLTAEHLAAEQVQIEAVLRQSQVRLAAAQTATTAAEALQDAEAEAQQDHTNASHAGQLARNDVEHALAALPAGYRARAELFPLADTESALAAAYPTPVDLGAMREATTRLEATTSEARTLADQAAQRDTQRALRETLAGRLAELEVGSPVAVAAETETRQARAQVLLEQASGGAEELAGPLKEAQARATDANTALDGVRAGLHRAEADHQSFVRLHGELARGVDERLAAIPENWRQVCDGLTPQQVSTWETQRDGLAGADVRAVELADAKSKQGMREARLHQINADLAKIPDDARCAVAGLEAREREAQERHESAMALQRTAVDGRNELHRRQARRSELAQQRDSAARHAHLYGLLARYLGRDFLQRHLLQQAEVDIVARANDVLDRISHGGLRLDLRPAPESGTGARGGQKALDLVAYNMLTAGKPLLVGALSGSQRFRVAVSLALGIGEYASEGNRRIEAVIIDEGFGSLDQQGRGEMIAMIKELQNHLKGELKRIILVSHQEEFTGSFTHGYYIQLDGGTSRVSDLERTTIGRLAPDALEFDEADTVVRRAPAAVRP